MQNSAELQAVNEGLERGEGWIGYLFTKKDGVKVPSSFCTSSSTQAMSRSKSTRRRTEPEEAYRMLLDNRRRVNEGERVLPSEAAKLKYEDLMKVGQYSSKKVAGIR